MQSIQNITERLESMEATAILLKKQCSSLRKELALFQGPAGSKPAKRETKKAKGYRMQLRQRLLSPAHE